MQSTARESGKNSCQIAGQRILHQGAFAGAGDAAQNAVSQRDTPAHGVRRHSGLSLDLDLFGSVVEQTDADMIEAEILLDLAGNLAQHVDRIVAGDRRPGNVVEEGKLPGAALLFGEQAGILHGDRNLSGGRHQHIKIALFEDEFAVGVHGDHDSRRLVAQLVAQEDGRGDQALRRALRNVR